MKRKKAKNNDEDSGTRKEEVGNVYNANTAVLRALPPQFVSICAPSQRVISLHFYKLILLYPFYSQRNPLAEYFISCG